MSYPKQMSRNLKKGKNTSPKLCQRKLFHNPDVRCQSEWGNQIGIEVACALF